ncbi:hypothetical protein NTE_01377 [Candidatus Nitrososphaera evergladensis SR1]|uniref:Uncharacterized protein n=1 Tax=Candidatus Nitrososphaera evergladensis SR1 TaxID=1459636 RepID=A0A075MQS8_9ARCH|nr:hypothetical protein NTE_01377 [Candidatus Nitrososphaera evergladensis SR1]
MAVYRHNKALILCLQRYCAVPKRNFSTLDEFKANLHKEGATLVEFSGGKVPCILVSPKKYEEMLGKVYGRRVSADTLLDIFYDGRDVFVDVNIKFRDTDFEGNFLLYANDMLEWFEALAESGMMAMGPSETTYTNSQNIFMIQLPKKDAAEKALEIIKTNAKNRVVRGMQDG